MSSPQCLECGSKNVKTAKETNTFPIPFGPDAVLADLVDTCSDCGVQYVSEESDATIQNANAEAIQNADKESLLRMLKDLHSMGVKDVHIERVLRLPRRTINRWKAGESSSSVFPLMRFIRACPWLLDVAAKNFDEQFTAKTVCTVASKILCAEIESMGYQLHADITKAATLVIEITKEVDDNAYDLMSAPKNPNNLGGNTIAQSKRVA